MLAKHLLTISLLLPLMAISSAVHADHNYQHRPNQPAAYGAFNQAGAAPAASNTDWQGRPSLQQRSSRKPSTYQRGAEIRVVVLPISVVLFERVRCW